LGTLSYHLIPRIRRSACMWTCYSYTKLASSSR